MAKASKKRGAGPKKAAKKAKRAAKPAAKPSAKPPRAPAKARMAAFSAKVLQEEEEAVQVRTFNEARAGIEASATFSPKTGSVTPQGAEVKEKASMADLETFLSKRGSKPAPSGSGGGAGMEFEADPGPQQAQARPLDRPSERLVAPARRRKTALETPEDFGKVELRQATASGGRKVAAMHKDNLQRAADRMKPLAAAGEAKSKAKPERFEVAHDAPTKAARLPDLADFGEVEIGQQTLRGSRRVGRLKPVADDEKE